MVIRNIKTKKGK